jgi:three-Cys-motif partner protein
MAKDWGWWTQHKLNILGDYLQSFATAASNKASERIYLDLFAGSPENVSRETKEPILGSIHRAIAATPPFTRICGFELPAKARHLDADLRRRYPDRHEIKIYPGDCNDKINEALRDLAGVRWAPTFAFVDQYDHEVHWNTLKQLATFKHPNRTKAEIWILYGTSFYARGLRLQQATIDTGYASELTKMVGSEEWRDIAEGRRRQFLDPEQWRAEIVNLMRWRLERTLGYRYSRALTVRNTNGSDLYSMIFATDHDVGEKIMKFLYGKSPAQQEALRQHALMVRRDKKRRDRGQDTMFEVPREHFFPAGNGYEQAMIDKPPHSPYRLPG